MKKFDVVGKLLVHHRVHPYKARSIPTILMVRSLGPYIVLKKISLTICNFQRIPYKYCLLHYIPIKPQEFKADHLSYLYYVIITQQRVDVYNKRFDRFGDPPSTNPLSEVLGSVPNILNFEKSWKDIPITNQNH